MSWYQRPQKWIKGKRIRSLAHLARLTQAEYGPHMPYILIDGGKYRSTKTHPHVLRNRQWSDVANMFLHRKLYTTIINPKWCDDSIPF